MSDKPDNLTLELLREIRAEQKQMRTDIFQLMTAVNSNMQYTQRLGSRMNELRDDLEAMLKAETMGASLSWRRDLESRIERLEEQNSANH